MTTISPRIGVRLIGSGSAIPSRVVTNHDLAKVMDTNDEWIVQRTGIRSRNIIDPSKGEDTVTLAAAALREAIAEARIDAKELDLIILATMTPNMSCPASACQVAAAVGAGNCGAFDLNAACSGFVFSMNVAHDLIRGGAYKTIAVIGADTVSKHMSYTNAGRGTAIIFGDAAGAVILRATDDTTKGLLAQSMRADGEGWKEIYVPELPRDFPQGVPVDDAKIGIVQMNGSSVFKFAVGTFPDLIEETLEQAKLSASDVDMFVCHQSNARILASARERFGLPEEKLYINIDRFGNTVGASVPLCFDELRKAKRIRDGQKVMFLAFGGGLTWGSSLWQF
jgi:3-oxoacyl-[acyl-carrier-protein] synthase III